MLLMKDKHFIGLVFTELLFLIMRQNAKNKVVLGRLARYPILYSSNSGTAEFKLGGQDFTLSTHKHIQRATFTDMFNYYTNISQKGILESPVGFQALSWFSFKSDILFKFSNKCCTSYQVRHSFSIIQRSI